VKVCPACDARFAAADWVCPTCEWRAASDGPIHLIEPGTGADGFSAEFFERLIRVEAQHFWFRARNELIAWAVRRYFPAARTFLDAGAGTGQVTRAMRELLPDVQMTACEVFTAGLAWAGRQQTRAELVCADVRRLPWEDEFDVVGAFDVLEHVVEDVEAMRQLGRAARPGGGVIVTVPQHQWLWSPIDDYSGHQRRYSRRLLVARLASVGLHTVHVTSFMTLLLPVLMLSRLSRRDQPPDPDAETRIAPMTNTIGRALTTVERALLRTGASLPAGGSLLVVARRE